jgi:hypothetical protein
VRSADTRVRPHFELVVEEQDGAREFVRGDPERVRYPRSRRLLLIRVLINRPFAEQGCNPSELIQPPRAMWLGLLLLTAAVVAALGSAFPARHAAGTSVTEALRYESDFASGLAPTPSAARGRASR